MWHSLLLRGVQTSALCCNTYGSLLNNALEVYNSTLPTTPPLQVYNAGQKKRNSELRIFGAPTEGGGSTSSIVNHLQSWSTSSRELTKNSCITVAFLLTSVKVIRAWHAVGGPVYPNTKHVSSFSSATKWKSFWEVIGTWSKITDRTVFISTPKDIGNILFFFCANAPFHISIFQCKTYLL